MKYCDSCKKQFDGEMNFCPLCGQKLSVEENKCSKCGKSVPEGYKFCPFCGTEVNSTEVAVEEEEKNSAEKGIEEKATEQIDTENNVVFSIGERKFVYHKSIIDVYAVRKACIEAKLMVDKSYGAIYDAYGSIAAFLEKDGHADGVRFITSCLNTIVVTLIPKGYYKLDVDTILSEHGREIFKRWDELCEEIASSYNDINSWEQHEKDRREFRKNTRGRIVGGGFGISGAAKGMIGAGVANTATGLAHSMFNAVGNASTSSKASSMRRKKYTEYKDVVIRTISALVLDLDFYLEGYISPKRYYSSDILKINDKIAKGLIQGEDAVNILWENLQENPFVSTTYKLLYTKLPKYSYEIVAMATKFKISDKTGKFVFSADDYSFIEDFEDEHTILDRVIYNKEEYEQLVALRKQITEELDSYDPNNVDILIFNIEDLKIDIDIAEETLADYVKVLDLSYYEGLQKDIDYILKYLKELTDGEGKEKYNLCEWYTEEIINSYIELNGLVQKYSKATADIIEYNRQKSAYAVAGNAAKFFEMKPKGNSYYTEGKIYLYGEDGNKNLDIAMADFILGSLNKDSRCEYELGSIYGNIISDYTKLKFWMKRADAHGDKKAHEYLSENSTYFAQLTDLVLEEALQGDELKGVFCAYIIEKALVKIGNENKEEKLKYSKNLKPKEFFALDPQSADYYALGNAIERDKAFLNSEDISRAYYFRGALHGDVKCQYQLAVYYSNHAGEEGGPEKLKYWMKKAMASGSQDAASYLSDNNGYFSAVRDLTDKEALTPFTSKAVFTNFVLSDYRHVKRGKLFINRNDQDTFDMLITRIKCDTDLQGSFYAYPDIEYEKVFTAIKSYCKDTNITAKDVLLFYDNTIFGSGDDGIIVVAEGMIATNTKGIIAFEDIETIYRDGSDIYVRTMGGQQPIQLMKCSLKALARFFLFAIHELVGGKLSYDGRAEYQNIIRLSFN